MMFTRATVFFSHQDIDTHGICHEHTSWFYGWICWDTCDVHMGSQLWDQIGCWGHACKWGLSQEIFYIMVIFMHFHWFFKRVGNNSCTKKSKHVMDCPRASGEMGPLSSHHKQLVSVEDSPCKRVSSDFRLSVKLEVEVQHYDDDMQPNCCQSPTIIPMSMNMNFPPSILTIHQQIILSMMAIPQLY
jgi:hypothetical protein